MQPSDPAVQLKLDYEAYGQEMQEELAVMAHCRLVLKKTPGDRMALRKMAVAGRAFNNARRWRSEIELKLLELKGVANPEETVRAKRERKRARKATRKEKARQGDLFKEESNG